MASVSLALCLFVRNLHANRVSECEDALMTIPSVLELANASSNTEMIEVSTINNFNSMEGIFSFPINDQQKKEIKIEYKLYSVDVDMYFLSQVSFKFLKRVLDEMPASLLSKVDKITVLFTEKFRLEASPNPSRRETLKLEEISYPRTEANEITLVIPYLYLHKYYSSYLLRNYSDNIYSDFLSEHLNLYLHEYYSSYLFKNYSDNIYFGFLHEHLIYRMRHKLGHVMAYHRYGELTSDQRWHDAIAQDNESVSQYGDVNMAEDFAEAMRVYLETNAGLNHPDIAKKYSHRFAILDEVVGLDSSERKRISERNHLFEKQIQEVNYLFRQLGIVDNNGAVIVYYKGEGEVINEDTPREIIEVLPGNPDWMVTMRILANKALALHRNKPLNFTSLDTSSVREILIRKLIWPGLLFLPRNNGENTSQFIRDTIDSLDALSISEIEHRLYVFEKVFKIMVSKNSNEEPDIMFEKAIEEVQSRVD